MIRTRAESFRRSNSGARLPLNEVLYGDDFLEGGIDPGMQMGADRADAAIEKRA